MRDHVFRWNGKTIRLLYSIDDTPSGRRLTLEDVLATSIANVEAVPDWKIEVEASWVAAGHAARYM